MMKKISLLLVVLVLGLTSCKLDTWLGYETVEPSKLYTITVGPTYTPAATATPTKDPNVTPSPVPTLGLGSTKISPVDGMTMVYIPAGEFYMGGYKDTDEVPIHMVFVNPYWMDQTEVTCGQFLKFVGETGFKKSSFAGGQCARGDDHPARATWDAAQAYCQWAGRRLPTEAEWERAARGGLPRKKYPWGDEPPVCELGAKNGAMFYDGDKCFVTGTVPVKSYQPNEFGLFDMAGNASEWVYDYYAENYYEIAQQEGTSYDNPRGPETGNFRVYRGGSYRSDADTLRSASRDGMPGQNFFGFRCAADAP